MRKTKQKPPDPDSLPAWPSLEQAATYLNVSERSVRRRIQDGSLIAVRVGPRLIRVDRASLLALARPAGCRCITAAASGSASLNRVTVPMRSAKLSGRRRSSAIATGV
ncbi:MULTISPECIES: helix-turn-helix domain-containing protein [unclassified Mycobacterium]|uniref:helix-turn-helix domain-containing protein n=1 Tax=unclassified Mycobacterium TaxID=2642494 RepID=UPI0009E7BE2A|nr:MULTISPECIES: helix-turn-helix domain-containing protein [unclassified Mycobacterium]